MLGKSPRGLYQVPKNAENDGPRGEGDLTKFIDLRFERWQVLGLKEGKRGQEVS